MLAWDEKYVVYAQQRGSELREEVAKGRMLGTAPRSRRHLMRPIRYVSGILLSRAGIWLVRAGERLQAPRVEPVSMPRAHAGEYVR